MLTRERERVQVKDTRTGVTELAAIYIYIYYFLFPFDVICNDIFLFVLLLNHILLVQVELHNYTGSVCCNFQLGRQE